MGNEVTTKDLQSLQGFVNKKLAEVEKKVADLGKRIEEVNKGIAENATKALREGLDAQDKRMVELHNKQEEKFVKAINDLAARVAKLE